MPRDSDNASRKKGVGGGGGWRQLQRKSHELSIRSTLFDFTNVYNIRLNFLINVIIKKVLIFSKVTEILGIGSQRVCVCVRKIKIKKSDKSC